MESPTSLETLETVRKTSRFLLPASVLIVLLTVAAGGMYAWYYWYNPCEVDAVEEASAFLVGQMNTYDAAYQFATTSSRTALTRPVNVLRQIFMDTKEVAVPACMQTAKNELLNYMGTVISAFQAFMVGETNTTIRGLVDQATTHLNNFTTELDAINKCAPFCAPWD